MQSRATLAWRAAPRSVRSPQGGALPMRHGERGWPVRMRSMSWARRRPRCGVAVGTVARFTGEGAKAAQRAFPELSRCASRRRIREAVRHPRGGGSRDGLAGRRNASALRRSYDERLCGCAMRSAFARPRKWPRCSRQCRMESIASSGCAHRQRVMQEPDRRSDRRRTGRAWGERGRGRSWSTEGVGGVTGFRRNRWRRCGRHRRS